jgi:serine/threonine protein kinase
MQLETGPTLHQYIYGGPGRGDPARQLAEAKLILYPLLEGVNYLHQRRIVHRDLKPGKFF